MSAEALFLGLDLGTSGARAVVVDTKGTTLAAAKSAMADHGDSLRDPAVWAAAARGHSRKPVARPAWTVCSQERRLSFMGRLGQVESEAASVPQAPAWPTARRQHGG